MHRQKAEEKVRGTIVVDSSALCYLSLHSGASHKKYDFASKPRYMDMLYALADHGYKIIIPEMVTYECSYLLADGTDAYGKLLPGIPLSRIRTEIKHTIEEARHHPNVSIRHITHSWDECNTLRYINAVRGILKQAERKSVSEHDIRYAIRGFCDQNLGEQAAAKLIKIGPDNGPYFFLSNDREGFHIVQRNCSKQVGCLSIQGLLHALCEQGLWSEAYIPAQKGFYSTIIADMENQASQMQGKSMHGHILETIDTVSHDLHQKDHPFHKSLDSLREEIAAAKAASERLRIAGETKRAAEEQQRIADEAKSAAIEKRRITDEARRAELERYRLQERRNQRKKKIEATNIPDPQSDTDSHLSGPVPSAPLDESHPNIQRFMKRWGSRVTKSNTSSDNKALG